MLSASDRAAIFKLVEELTGATHAGDSRQDSLVANVERRMSELHLTRLVDYLKLVDEDPKEAMHLVSALTIHTTSWFRENPHFVAFQQMLLEALKKNEVFRVWCAACSTGEEVYSFALLLEEFRRVHPSFNYAILGTDIDQISLAVAERAVYAKKNMGFHVIRYKAHILEGTGKTEPYFTLSREIRERCTFRFHDLRNGVLQKEAPFHVVICRNVLIYFSPETCGKVVANLLLNLRTDGNLILGHSESINGGEFSLTAVGHSVYRRRAKALVDDEGRRLPGKYRVLVIEDSATERRTLSGKLSELGFDAASVGTLSEASSFLNFNEVDLITLSAKLASSHGEKWLRTERQEGLKTPVVIIGGAGDPSDLLPLGAQEYLDLQLFTTDSRQVKSLFLDLIGAHQQALGTPLLKTGGTAPSQRPDLILIGASTGGPQALARLLEGMPKSCPPIAITQHMSSNFIRPLAERMAAISGLTLGSVGDGHRLQAGHIYLALGDYHLGFAQGQDGLVLRPSTAPPFNGHRPSVDYMFNSALGLRASVMAILLTGMGRDGALGLRFLHQEGAYCVAQSEEDCVVYGMPKEAIEREAVDFVGDIDAIRKQILLAIGMESSSVA